MKKKPFITKIMFFLLKLQTPKNLDDQIKEERKILDQEMKEVSEKEKERHSQFLK